MGKVNFDAVAAQLATKGSQQEGVDALLTIDFKGDYATVVETLAIVDKLVTVTGEKDKKLAESSAEALNKIFDSIAPWAAAAFMPKLEEGLDGKAKPPTKEVCLDVVKAFSEKPANDAAMGREIDTVINKIVFLMNDPKKSVKEKAKSALIAVGNCSGNKDLKDQDMVGTIVLACENLKNVGDCVEKLAGNIFVQNVESPALSVMTPVLWRGLSDKNELTNRRCCVIVDNMCKLIDDPREGSPLMPQILPLVTKKAAEISDPEARENAEKTLTTISKIEVTGRPKDLEDIKDLFVAAGTIGAWTDTGIEYFQAVGNKLNRANYYDLAAWEASLGFFAGKAEIKAVVEKIQSIGKKVIEEFVDEDESAPDLYKGSFSLAYGTLTLLRDTKLHLKKFKFYGMLGPNNCGKTTLMRAISREQVEGFPKRDELVTIFVEHEVEEEELLPPGTVDETGKRWDLGKFNIDLSGIEFVMYTCNKTYKKDPPVQADIVEQTLGEIGFKNSITGVNPKAAANMCNPITTYSGGWKVKMQLACALLINADILMLDEPTGHLDVKNIAWMKNWLANFPGSIVATSANSEFLDEMCTHMIDFEDRKLIQFKSEKGRVLTDFVAKYPEKKSYFELSNKKQKFIFPQPGPLEGVKSKGRAILKMSGVSFKYATHEKNTVQDIALSVCMLSRVGVVGPNGAGKSTAIKLLIGELKPITGVVWRHSGCRMAYVAQHAFHHLEKHMDKTPCQYILWRFAGNDDRESLENQTKEINVDEEALRAVKWCVDSKSGVVRKCVPGEKGDVPVFPDTILNRRKNKAKKYEYEVKWMHKSIELSCWVERETMCSMGYEKMVCREDEKQAAAAGLMAKPLTQPSVEKALKDFGLDVESASHNPIASLSGGQKVKVVLSAAMWMCPHILILDEPTNYLDRDGLGALALGLQEFGGGVVIISHNMEFTNSVAQQKWIMEAGFLREEGEIMGDEDMGDMADGPDEVVDGSGNKIEVSKVKSMTDKERKKAIKEIEKRLKEHKKKNTMSEAEMWELQDKLAELKIEMGA